MIKVVLNGCFDLFHEGHQHILSKALGIGERGHILILINTDESVSRIKGPGRPAETLTTRISHLQDFIIGWSVARLEYPQVTYIPFSEESELKNHIDRFEPDVIIKGSDRPDVRTIVGSDRWPVMIVPQLKDYNGNVISTTSLLDNDTEIPVLS